MNMHIQFTPDGTAHCLWTDAVSLHELGRPMRLAALSVKAQQISALIRFLLATEDVVFGDPRLFFRELELELEHPYTPRSC